MKELEKDQEAARLEQLANYGVTSSPINTHTSTPPKPKPKKKKLL
jgi:hypothetical protein